MKPEVPDYLFKKDLANVMVTTEKMVFKSTEAGKAFYRTYGKLLVEAGKLTQEELKKIIDRATT